MIISVNISQACIQFGIVSRKGKVLRARKFETRDWIASGGILPYLIIELKKYLRVFPEIKQLGIGLPGLLSRDRKSIIHVPYMPSLDNLFIADLLADEFPQLEIKCERSANCMALGEYWFGNYLTNNFLLVSLDTCMESAAIINKELFLGAHGNGVQLANVLTDGEQPIGKELRWNNLEEYIYRQMDQQVTTRSLLAGKSLSAELVYRTALLEDKIAQSVFIHAGCLLGKALIAALTMLDVTTILLTGNLASATNLMLPSINEQLRIHLAEYYTQQLTIKKAVVGEKAGLLGAACLFM